VSNEQQQLYVKAASSQAYCLTCHPSTQEAEAEDHEFQTSQDHIVRRCYKQQHTTAEAHC
jgi:hypothetical protein